MLTVTHCTVTALNFIILFIFSGGRALGGVRDAGSTILLVTTNLSTRTVFFCFAVLTCRCASSNRVNMVGNVTPFLTVVTMFMLSGVGPADVGMFTILLSLINTNIVTCSPAGGVRNLGLNRLFTFLNILNFIACGCVLNGFNTSLGRHCSAFSDYFCRFNTTAITLLVLNVMANTSFASTSILVRGNGGVADVLTLNLLYSNVTCTL